MMEMETGHCKTCEVLAARIAELEAALTEATTNNPYRKYCIQRDKELAALRRKIDEAPVVMEVGNGELIYRGDLK